MKKITINNKIFMILIVLLVIYNISKIFENFNNLLLLITGISIIVIYIISFLGLLRNNKTWAWWLGILPSLWILFSPLRVGGSFMYGRLLLFFEAFSMGDTMTPVSVIPKILIHLALIIFIIINLILFKKGKERYYSLKQNKVIALLIAIFFSLFVWLYLRKYKKFFIWLGILILLGVSNYIIFYLGNPTLWVISEIVGLVLAFYIWICAIIDASKVGQIKLNKSGELKEKWYQ